jgi:hypothetical protein
VTRCPGADEDGAVGSIGRDPPFRSSLPISGIASSDPRRVAGRSQYGVAVSCLVAPRK